MTGEQLFVAQGNILWAELSYLYSRTYSVEASSFVLV